MTDTIKRKPVIGLVGGIGSGKSLVARLFASLGCAVVSADDLARQAMNEPQVQQTLINWWGPAILNPDGQVNRQAIADRVFHNPSELKRLEDLIHPRVFALRQTLYQRYQHDPSVLAIVEDTPLLMEKGLDAQCDVIVFVDAAPETRLSRVHRARGWSPEELDRRQNRQWPLDRKAARADYVVDNNAGEAECLTQIRRVLSRILPE